MYPEFVLIKYNKAHRHRNECHEEKPYYAHRSPETGGVPRRNHWRKHQAYIGGKKRARGKQILL